MDLICFCHLRWNFVYQRPQHLMSRFAGGRVFLIEEPIFDAEQVHIESEQKGNVTVITPHLPHGLNEEDIVNQQVSLLNDLFIRENIQTYLFWYYTPMALAIGNHFKPSLIIYDCMDELSII